MSQTYTVQETGTYTDATTGSRYRLTEGDVITMARAVHLGLPDAELPEPGPPFSPDEVAYIRPTIHNWFPDGTVSSAALIDTEGSFDDPFLWQQAAGVETLAFAEGDGHGGGNAVSVVLPGTNAGEGVTASDQAGIYGCDEIPAGDWFVRFWAKADDEVILRLTATTPAAKPPAQVVTLNTAWQSFAVPVTLASATYLGFKLATSALDYPDPAPLPATTILISQLMVTESESRAFADGDSDGWSWSGDANASASFGPQP